MKAGGKSDLRLLIILDYRMRSLGGICIIFSNQMNHLSLDNFNLINTIGKGSYAKVVLVKKKGDDSRTYAMKILKKKYIEKRKQESHVMTERNILAEVDHPFIVKLHYSFQN